MRDQSNHFLNFPNLDGHWENLGYWGSESDTYKVAAQRLASRVGEEACLKEGDRVLDLGSGYGDQISLWFDRFRIAELVALNPDQNQQRIAQTKVSPCLRGSVTLDIKNHNEFDGGPWDKVVAVDAAYFFSSFHEFLNRVFYSLNRGGCFAWTDVLLQRPIDRAFSRLKLRGVSNLTGIESAHWQTPDQCRERLQAIGFQRIVITDIGEAVIDGFCAFVKKHRRLYGRQFSSSHWRKSAATAAVLKHLYKHDIVSYFIISAWKKP